jgi:hypothetical protein
MKIALGSLRYDDNLGEGEVRFTPTYRQRTASKTRGRNLRRSRGLNLRVGYDLRSQHSQRVCPYVRPLLSWICHGGTEEHVAIARVAIKRRGRRLIRRPPLLIICRIPRIRSD